MVDSNRTIYILFDDDGRFLGGPYAGQAGLNISALASEFRTEKYAKAEQDEDDYCFFNSDEFPAWLVQRGLLTLMEAECVTAVVDTSGENRYSPKHWPTCPSCGVGRGDTAMGRVLHELNRVDWHRQCMECGHTWEHHDTAYYSDRPMLDDDGRCIDSGCVPYSISQAGELPIEEVINVCRECGWSEGYGIDTHNGIAAAHQLGLTMSPWRGMRVAGKLTLRKLFEQLDPACHYIIATKGHWLAVVRGENRDQADTHLRSEVLDCWEVRRAGG
ncbi:hypothetical protein A9R05_42810 (plasmid) [Burkholderia sp. KK1]|uniref:Uncharacterized protein n=1 Tax=Burkholderia sp. M701 TaxID=326454 RepID=V5YP09_9BURK|nr:hypothetical protein [Burkholderia sp. M701]AQH05751.1 hypothetical protein A9R05_42810 [Burkholderia sp. KK1]BAO18984.1 hypothetical protein [Burkholderia sp. M701]